MTTAMQVRSIGKRVMALRKEQGFRTARDLADAIPEGRVTEATIQNIESGRRSDLSVSQLLEISAALRVSPMLLLVPVGLPYERIDLANLSEALRALTVAEFEEWLAPNLVSLNFSESGLENTLRLYRSTIQRVVKLDARRTELHETISEQILLHGVTSEVVEPLLDDLGDLDNEIERLRSRIEANGLDASWIPTPKGASERSHASGVRWGVDDI